MTDFSLWVLHFFVSGLGVKHPLINQSIVSGQNRDLSLPDIVTAEALENIKETSDLTVMATVKQTPGNSGSIVAFSTGIIR